MVREKVGRLAIRISIFLSQIGSVVVFRPSIGVNEFNAVFFFKVLPDILADKNWDDTIAERYCGVPP